jgi:hypothetical protein
MTVLRWITHVGPAWSGGVDSDDAAAHVEISTPDDATKFLDGTGGWSVPPGTGSPALTTICDQLLSGSQASFDTNTILGGNIPSTYKHLVFEFVLRSDNSGLNEDLLVRFNNDSTSAHYNTQRLGANGTSVSGAESIGTLAGFFAALVPGNTAPSGHAGAGTCRIQNYASTTFNKYATCNTTYSNSASSAGMQTEQYGGLWLSTAAITRIQLLPLVGSNWLTGSRFTLLGEG